jgi:His-Xaa-Ser system protein HxsD
METEPIAVEFDCVAQSISALRAAAYRLIGTATCEISKVDERWVCRLVPVGKGASNLRARFVDLVTDENLRETIAAKTEPTRNLILALAFGHLAAPNEGRPQ